MGRPLPSELTISERAETRGVILGMPGPWAEDNMEPSDHYTTKIGGVPDWPMPLEEADIELLKCGLCGGDLALVAQVYAPVSVRDTWIDERTIYIFGCPSSSCGVSPLSWRTLRVQKNVISGASDNNIRVVGSGSEASSSSMGELIEGNLSEADEDLEHDHHDTDWCHEDIWGVSTGMDDPDNQAFMAMEELEVALLEAGYREVTPLAAHIIDEEEEIAPALDDVSVRPGGLPVLPCFYVYSQNESHPSRGSRAVSALEQAAESEYRDNAMEGREDCDEYEHYRVPLVDRMLLKFKKRLNCYPEQCFRYRFRGTPLWANNEMVEPTVCSHCGGPRIYEMQLMPPLLFFLQQACKDSPLTSCSANDWDWLTLIVFSCAQSCTPYLSGQAQDGQNSKPWIIVEEGSVLQYEN